MLNRIKIEIYQVIVCYAKRHSYTNYSRITIKLIKIDNVKEDVVIRWHKCPFGLVVKNNFEFNFFLFKNIKIQVCKSIISNFIQFLIY